jgi:hypothetical protein
MRVFWRVALAVGAASGVAAAQSPAPAGDRVAAEPQSHEAPAATPLATSSAWVERPFAIDGSIGLGMPLGNLGVSLEYAPIRWVSLGAGVGTNIDGRQLAGMVRFRFTPNKPASLFAGGGYSQGPWRQGLANRYGLLSVPEGMFESTAERPGTPWRSWKRGRWINLELGGEKRQDNGFDVRGFGGVALLLNSDQNTVDPVDQNSPDTPPPLKVVPLVVYFGAGFGFSL